MAEMTPLQKRCQELLPVIQAGAEGKAIQWKISGDEWNDNEPCDANFVECSKYRIKPESKYRPFTPVEAARELLGHLIARAGECGHSFVTAINEGGVLTNLHGDISYQELASSFLKNGAPCGVLVQE